MSKDDNSAAAQAAKDAARRERSAQAFDELESSICDLHLMSILAAEAVEGAIGNSTVELTGNPEFHFIPKQQVETVLFAVFHLKKMLRAFKQDYYAVLEAES